MKLVPVQGDPFAQAQPQQPGMSGVQPKLRPVNFNPFADYSAADLPEIWGPAGLTGEFVGAAGKTHMQGIGTGFRSALADMFGSYEDVAKSVQDFAPGAKLVKDRDGFPVLELPNGKRFALNKPGVQGRELANVTGNVLSYLPAGKAVSALSAGRGLLTRAAIAAPAAGLTDMALQKLAGREEIDPMRTAITAAGGSVGELVAPALGKLADMAFQKLKGAFSNPAAMQAQAAQVLRDAGVSAPTNGMVSAITKRWDELRAGLDPKTVLAEAETGVKLTRGQKTGDYGALRREEMLRQSDSLGGSKIREVDRQNMESLAGYFQRMRSEMGGKAEAVGDAFDRVGQTVRSNFDAAKSQVQSLYDKAGNAKAFVGADSIRSLPAKLKESVREWPIDEVLTPSAKRTLDMIKGQIGELPNEVSAVSLKAVETMRRRLNGAIGSAANPSDQAALKTIKSTFDNWFDSLDSAIVKGDKAAPALIKEARQARADMGARFESRAAGDGVALVERMIQGNATGQELAEAAFGVAQTGKANAVQFIRAAKKALGKGPGGEMNPVFGELKSAYLQKLTVGPTGEMLGPQAIMGNIKRALNTRKDVMKELYTPDEMAKLERATAVLEQLVPKGMVGRSSGTAERAFAYLEQILGGVPFGGQLLKAMQAPGQAMQASVMYQPIRPRGLGDELSLAIGASTPQQTQR